MRIRNRNDDQEKFAEGWDAIFGGKKKKSRKKTKSTESCPSCRQPKQWVEVKNDSRTSCFAACINQDCKYFYQPPQEIKNCGTHDTFGYRAGANMAKAQDERRRAEAASKFGANPYRAIDDLNNDAAWRS